MGVNEVDVNDFSRIDKVFVDQVGISPAASRDRRGECRIDVHCGPEIRTSRALRAAALTFIELAARCFPGAVIVEPDALVVLLGEGVDAAAIGLARRPNDAARYAVAFGDTSQKSALQVSFDGWTAQVAPGGETRLPEGDECPLSAILAAAIAVSEIFLDFAGLEPAATRRRVQLSLWEPWSRTPARGPALRYLPSQAWLIGLGHLGQAYAWAFAHLPFPEGSPLDLLLVDDERVVKANVETGVLNRADDVDDFKTRVVSRWLEARGVRTRILERRIDPSFRLIGQEPRLLIGGVDDNTVRQWLAQAGGTLIDCGLGNRADNFDTIALRTWPNDRVAADLWPPLDVNDSFVARLVKQNSAYMELADDDCGRVRLAERSVGVPYVGMIAACFAWANMLRDLHEGDHVMELKVRLATPQNVEVVRRPFLAERVGQVRRLDRQS